MRTSKFSCGFALQRPHVVSRRVFLPITINLCHLFAVFAAFGVFIAAGKANGHEFEDGFVERSVAVVVRDNVARLEYSIGLNPNTRQQLIKFWQSTDGVESGTESDDGEKTESTQQKVDFYQLAADHLSRRLEIVVNKQRVQPKLISALPSSRHHVDVTVVLEFILPATEAQVPIAIEIADGNFFRKRTGRQENAGATLETYHDVSRPQRITRDAPHLWPAPFGGGFRYALKTMGSTVINSSNIASILIRADRHIDDDFTDAQLERAFRIKAKVSNILATPANQGR